MSGSRSEAAGAREPRASRRPIGGTETAGRDLLSVSSAQAVAAVLTGLTVVLATHLLTPAGYAVLAYVQLVGLLLLYVTSSWTAAALVRYGREELERHGTLRATSTARLAISGPLLGVGVVVALVLELGGWLPDQVGWQFVGLGIALGIGLTATEHLVGLLQAEGRMRVSALALVGRQAVVVVGFAAVGVVGAGGDPLTLATITVGAGLVLALVLARTAERDALWPRGIDRAVLRRLVLFSTPLIAFTLGQYVLRSVDLVVLGIFTTAAEVGLYAVAYQVLMVLQQLPSAAPAVLSPLFVSMRERRGPEHSRRYLEVFVPQLVWLAALLVGIAAPLVEPLIRLVLGEDYAGAAPPLTILLGALLLFAYASFVVPVLLAEESTKAMAAATALAALVNVAGDVVAVGVLNLGPRGPALATCLALGALAVLYLRAAARAVSAATGFRPLLLLPGLAGVVAAATLPNSFVLLVPLLGVPLLALAIARLDHVFAAPGRSILNHLPMPARLRAPADRLLGAYRG